MPSPAEIFWVCLAFAFVFGALIGSFLNVVIYRVPAGLSIVTPGSRCPTCETPVRWYDNLPIVSWFVLGGKCRHCGAKFSIRYAAVEALTGLLAAAAWWQIGRGLLTMDEIVDLSAFGPVGVMFLMRFTLFAFLVVITFIDLDHFLIPHVIAIPGIVIGLASPWVAQWMMGPAALQFLWPPVTPMLSLAGAILGFLIILGLFYAYLAVRGAEGIGGGDATLMALVGAWLGWPALIFVLFAASLQGVIAAGLSLALGGNFAQDASSIFVDDEPQTPDPAEAAPGAETPIALDSAQESSEPAADEPEELLETEVAAADPEPVSPDEMSQAEQGEQTNADVAEATPEAHSEAASDETNEDVYGGRLAVPFGPFIALAALEYALFGPYLPDELNMIYLYF